MQCAVHGRHVYGAIYVQVPIHHTATQLWHDYRCLHLFSIYWAYSVLSTGQISSYCSYFYNIALLFCRGTNETPVLWKQWKLLLWRRQGPDGKCAYIRFRKLLVKRQMNDCRIAGMFRLQIERFVDHIINLIYIILCATDNGWPTLISFVTT